MCMRVGPSILRRGQSFYSCKNRREDWFLVANARTYGARMCGTYVLYTYDRVPEEKTVKRLTRSEFYVARYIVSICVRLLAIPFRFSITCEISNAQIHTHVCPIVRAVQSRVSESRSKMSIAIEYRILRRNAVTYVQWESEERSRHFSSMSLGILKVVREFVHFGMQSREGKEEVENKNCVSTFLIPTVC